jgi:hypothetical protein
VAERAPGTPPLGELFRRATYFFVNLEPALDFDRPLPSKVRFFGGIVDESSMAANGKKVAAKLGNVYFYIYKIYIVFFLN